MIESVIRKELLIQSVLDSVTMDELITHLHRAFGFIGDIQKNIDSFECLQTVLAVYADSDASTLDLYTAYLEYRNTSVEARKLFDEELKQADILERGKTISIASAKAELDTDGKATCEKYKTVFDNLLNTNIQVQVKQDDLEKLCMKRDKCVIASKKKSVEEEEYKKISAQLELIKQQEELKRAEFPAAEFPACEQDKLAYETAMRQLWDKKMKLYSELYGFITEFGEKKLLEVKQLFEDQIHTAEEACTQAQEKLMKQEEALLSVLSDELFSYSGITEEQAATWAEQNVSIAENGQKKLRRIGYPPEQLKKDVATFYRYVGGKMGPVQFILEGRSRRAFARGKATIALQGAFGKRTLFHECAHLVEHWDTALGEVNTNFIKNRATGKPTSLKQLTGCAYKADEKAHPDQFVHPYVGKIYPNETTEVLSMGLECFSSPQALAALFQKDPEHFRLILGVCKRQNPFLSKKLEKAYEKNSEMRKQLSSFETWWKALTKVSGPAFGKLLTPLEGYKGYSISSYGRTIWLNRMTGATSGIASLKGSAIVVRAIAYLLIARSDGVLFTEIPPEEMERHARMILGKSIVPDWFDPVIPLPKV